MDEIKKIIEDRLKKLPEETVNSLNEIRWIDELLKISRENNFNQDQEDSFITESTVAILGIEDLDKYPENLSENVGLDDDTVVKIAKEVDEKILTPLNEKILSSKKDLIKESSEKIDWSGKVDEISKKYNLNDTQKNILNSLSGEILSNMDKKGTLLKDMDQKLSVSKLLSEQIIDDLNKRVFDYTIKSIEAKPINKIPEIKPVNLPMVENNVTPNITVPKYVPTGISGYKPTGLGGGQEITQKNIMPAGDSRIEYKPISIPPLPQTPVTEPVQKPAQVPRFNALVDEPNVSNPPSTTPSPSSIMDNKLNNITTGLKESSPEEVKKETPLVKQYTIDPYREPLA